MNRNTTIRQKLYSLAAIIGTTYIVFHLILLIFSNDVKSKWDNYNQEIKSKNVIISLIRSDFGYGGMIHMFKNYLIRGKKDYAKDFEQKYLEFLEHKTQYMKLKNVTKFETESLQTIENTFTEYKYKLPVIEKLKSNGKSIEEIDKVIQINDSQAILAMSSLEKYFEMKRHETTRKINTTIEYIYSLSILVVFSILFFTFYLKRFFENTIIQPLLKIEEGLISFFRFLSNKKYIVKPIAIRSNDEFGIMARSINKNIVLTTTLHNDLTNKNQEFEKLIESYGQNVIASKTDLDGIITYASEAFESISGYTKDELMGKPHSIVRHKDMPQSAFEEMWNVIQSGKTWEGEVKNRKKNGDYYYVKATIAPIFDENYTITGYSAIREDITNHKEVIELNKQLDVYKNHLESKVTGATKKIEDLMNEIEDTQKEVVFTMGAIGERRSAETGNHVKRVAEYSKLFALYSGLSEKDAEMLRQASPMHDIGKVGIADSILNKPGILTPIEHKTMQEHTTLGYNMLKSSKRELLKTAAIVAYEHHERWDGKGYPRGLKEEEIHLYARITAIADVFDALGSHRVYKDAWSDEKIFTLFNEERGKQFDPKLIDIFFEHIDEFLDIREKFCDKNLKEIY